MESAYIMMHLWAKAVQKAQSLDTNKVREPMYSLTFDAPQGSVTMQTNHHIAKQFALGKVNEKGLFDVMYKQDLFYPRNRGIVCGLIGPQGMRLVEFLRGEMYDINALQIGLLHSFSGHMAASERTVYDMGPCD